MTVHEIVLIVHVMAALVLSAMLGIEAVSVARLRCAATWSEASPWITPLRSLPVIAGASVLIVLLSGLQLVAEEGAMGQAWPKIATASLVLMAPLAAVTSRRLRNLRKACSANLPQTFQLLRDPLLKLSLAIRVAVFFGIFLLVSIKPSGWWPPIFVVGGCASIGWLASLLDFGQGKTAVGRTQLGD